MRVTVAVTVLIAFASGSAIKGDTAAAAEIGSWVDSSPADARSALTCIQNALGGTAAFAAVSSLHIKGETKPLSRPGPIFMLANPAPRDVDLLVGASDEDLSTGLPVMLNPDLEVTLDLRIRFHAGSANADHVRRAGQEEHNY